MISFLEGKIEHIGDKWVILSAGGIGYRVYILPKVLSIIAKNQAQVNPLTKVFVHSQLNMREGTFDMYGFDKREDLDLFNLLISVSGIGPKNAMHILTTIEPRHLKVAVMNDDADYLRKVSSLGPKTAQRLILELKNKIEYLDVGDISGMNLGEESQALDALMVLGYSQHQAKDVLKKIPKDKTLEERVREALKDLGKK